MRKFINLPERPEESLDILAFVIFFGTVGLFTLFILWGFIYVLGFWGIFDFYFNRRFCRWIYVVCSSHIGET